MAEKPNIIDVDIHERADTHDLLPPAKDKEPVYEVKVEDGKVLVSSEPVE